MAFFYVFVKYKTVFFIDHINPIFTHQQPALALRFIHERYFFALY